MRDLFRPPSRSASRWTILLLAGSLAFTFNSCARPPEPTNSSATTGAGGLDMAPDHTQPLQEITAASMEQYARALITRLRPQDVPPLQPYAAELQAPDSPHLRLQVVRARTLMDNRPETTRALIAQMHYTVGGRPRGPAQDATAAEKTFAAQAQAAAQAQYDRAAPSRAAGLTRALGDKYVVLIGLDHVGVLAAAWVDTQAPGGQPALLATMNLHVYDAPPPISRLETLPGQQLYWMIYHDKKVLATVQASSNQALQLHDPLTSETVELHAVTAVQRQGVPSGPFERYLLHDQIYTAGGN